MTPPRSPKSPFLSGYIEGYYGRLPTFDERLDTVRKLRAIGAGHYLYAPKEDPYHRREWRAPYPAAWRTEFRAFAAASRRLGVRVVPGIAPGLSYRYHKEEDFRALVRKLQSLIVPGCDEAALLLDDIPDALPGSDRTAFRSLGHAHGVLLRTLWPRLQRRGLRRLWFCPTVYTDRFAGGRLADNPYLQDLVPGLLPGIELFWTGRDIVSPDYRSRELAALTRVTGIRPVIWDNLYANDYCPGKIYLGPFRGRPRDLRRSCRGLLLNPTGLHHTDLFHLDLLGGFLRGEAPAGAWRKSLRAHGVPKEFLTIAPLLESPFVRADAKSLGAAKVRAYRAALKSLLWEWKSPLQREWYPYLYALDGDLRLLEKGAEAPDEAWVRKKYSAVMAGKLLGIGFQASGIKKAPRISARPLGLN